MTSPMLHMLARRARPIAYVTGAVLIVAWFVTLAARASIGAAVPPLATSAAVGGLPPTPAPLRPLVLPIRDPFAADVDPAANRLAKRPTSIAAMQVPDPASFGGAAASGRGVLAVIVGDRDSYALLEDGANIIVGHVGDAFAGSTIAEISEHGVRLANNVTLAVDDPRKSAAPAMQTVPPFTAPAAQRPDGSSPSAASSAVGASPQFGRTLPPGTVAPPAIAQPPAVPSAVGLPTSAQPTIVVPPAGTVQGVELRPGVYPGAASAGSSFPLTSAPSPSP